MERVKMMRKILKCRYRICKYVLLLAAACTFPARVYAADAVTAFGSTEYTAEADGGEFPVGIYIRADEEIGSYHLELRYDSTRMDYVSGAESEENGLLTLDGTGTGEEVKVFLYFKATGGGDAGIAFTSAEVYTADGREQFNITELAYAPVAVSGEDTDGISFEEMLEELTLGEREEEGRRAENQVGTGQEGADQEGTDRETAGSVPQDTGSAAMEGTETEISHSVSSAEAIYERSRQETVENNRDRMLGRFLYFAAFFAAAVFLAAVIVRIWNNIRGERQEPGGAPVTPSDFPFEFETISEKKRGETGQQIREGRNTQTLKAGKADESEYDLESDELDYDLEIENLDEGVEYIDL